MHPNTSAASPARLNSRDEEDRRIAEKLTRELGPAVMGYLKDPTVTGISLNPDGSLWVKHLGHPRQRVGRMAASQAESLMATIAAKLKVTITAKNPILECELPLDGSRFTGMIPPVVTGPTFTIRKHASLVFSLADYVAAGTMTLAQRDAIDEAVRTKKNILVVGGTDTGKTTLANAIIRHIADVAPADRLIIIEDTTELQPVSEDKVSLRVSEQADMLRLLKATLRSDPGRIIIGEVRDGAALTLLKGWNTGHPGGIATVHANSAEAGLLRMEQLIAEATAAPMQSLIAEAVNCLVFMDKAKGLPHVKDVLDVVGWDGHAYLTRPIE